MSQNWERRKKILINPVSAALIVLPNAHVIMDWTPFARRSEFPNECDSKRESDGTLNLIAHPACQRPRERGFVFPDVFFLLLCYLCASVLPLN